MKTDSLLPLWLAVTAGAGTALGAVVLLVLIPNPPAVNTLSAQNASLFGRLQACSAGVMLALSFGLFMEALPETGLPIGLLCMAVGFVIMFAIESLLADSTHSHAHSLEEGLSDEISLLDRNTATSPTSATPPPQIPTSFESFLIRMFGGSATASNSNTLMMVRSSFVTYMGLAIHNLPEGVSVALTSATNLRLGISLCLAILLHNILEGLIVALPIWYTSRSRSRVLFLTLLNGLMEPLGVILAWSLGGAEVIAAPGRIEKMLMGVSGIMGAIAVGELMPSAVEWIEKGGIVVAGGKSGRGKKEVYIRVFAWIVVGIIGGAFVMGLADFVLQKFDF
ncbi:hypothetical protein HDU98_012105 [Podochytrium sp. JEL0797]|nr:hypothetical protein HDU98_012105 [Podochytrium sp. JEL0797]